MSEEPRNLAADIYCDHSGKLWSAVITEHPHSGGPGQKVWERHNMRSEYNATGAMEAAWRRLQNKAL